MKPSTLIMTEGRERGKQFDVVEYNTPEDMEYNGHPCLAENMRKLGQVAQGIVSRKLRTGRVINCYFVEYGNGRIAGIARG